ncbi:MAG: hypothetical protein R3B90_06730 [Planctomycetaceae bacterium]
MSAPLWLLLVSPVVDTSTIRLPELRPAVVAWTADDLEEHVRKTILRVKDRTRYDAARDVPELILWYGAVQQSEVLPRAERVRLSKRLDYWIEESHERLIRDRAVLLKQSRQQMHAAKLTDSTRSNLNNGLSLQGGAAEARNVQQLIDLIEMTIQPDSWVNAGGRGSIGYYSPQHLLVIRNTQQAHHEIGGLLQVLGAQQ